MAAPFVTGLVGLLYSHYDGVHNTAFNPTLVRATILRYVDVVSTLNGWVQTSGRINAFKAVSSLLTPTGLTATVLPDQITLTWNDNATAFDRQYRVERKGPADADFVNITSGTPLTTFTDSSVSPGATYTYRVRAHNSISDSFYSNPVTVTASDDPPSPGTSSGGGGGGCSIGARQNTSTAMADLGVLLMPLLVFAVLRRRR
jgi:hypothetical protein